MLAEKAARTARVWRLLAQQAEGWARAWRMRQGLRARLGAADAIAPHVRQLTHSDEMGTAAVTTCALNRTAKPHRCQVPLQRE